MATTYVPREKRLRAPLKDANFVLKKVPETNGEIVVPNYATYIYK